MSLLIGSQLGYITGLSFLFRPPKTKQSLAIKAIQHSVGKRKNDTELKQEIL